MRSAKNLHFVIISFLLGIAAAIITCYFREMDLFTAHKVEWKLETPLVYDEQIKGKLYKMQEDGFKAVLWKKRNDVTIYDTDLGRTTCADVLAVAGDSSLLFPGENVLALDETEKCILGEEIAFALFGSADVVGRSVQIGQGKYYVAGVEYTEKRLCIYEAKADDGQKMTHAACYIKKKNESFINKQRVMQMLCIALLAKIE